MKDNLKAKFKIKKGDPCHVPGLSEEYNFDYKGYSKALEAEVKGWLTEIAVYVRDNHLCGTPLQEAIDKVVDKNDKKTRIKK